MTMKRKADDALNDEAPSKIIDEKALKKNSLDSDEEDDEDAEATNDGEDYEGQEEETLRNDGDIAITPFNLKDEAAEGTFTEEGHFVWKKDKEETRDSWLDNVDWSRVEAVSNERAKRSEEDDDREDAKEAEYDEDGAYEGVLRLLNPGESVAKALRRLGGGNKKKERRWNKKKEAPSTEEEKIEAENREKMLKLTGLADAILSRSGNMEIYQETYEKIAFKLKGKKTSIPEGTKDEDALDMFAASMDTTEETKEEERPTSATTATTTTATDDDEIEWEFKWTDEDSADVHGPHTSKEMFEWQESGFFESGVFVRKCGSESKEFNSSKRIDFELYT